MPIDLEAVLEFFSDAMGKIMIIAGFFFLIIAVSLFSRVYQWLSMTSFLLGVLLIVVGTILHFETLTWKVPSKKGWGTILICVSAMFMASAVAFFFFAVPGSAWILPTSFRRGDVRGSYIILIDLKRPSAWLTPIMGCIGIILLIFASVLKFFDDIF